MVLADLECDLDGELHYPNDVYQMINYELSEHRLRHWVDSAQREKVLRGFKALLTQHLKDFDRENYLLYVDIRDCIERKTEAGIFESTL